MNKAFWLAFGVLTLIVLAAGCSASPASSAGTGGGLFSSGPASSGAQVSSGTGQPTGINVSGEGKVTATPDTAIINVGVEARAQSVAAARDQAATAMNAVVSSLKGNGVAEKDIKTQYLSISPYQESKGRDTFERGFRVSNMVTAKVRKLDSISKVVDDAVAAGGNLVQVQGIGFTLDNPEPQQNEAREKAVANAKAKAQQLAKLAGVTLGKPTYIVESGGAMPPIYGRGAMMEAAAPAGAPTPISPGEMDVMVSVQVTFAIE